MDAWLTRAYARLKGGYIALIAGGALALAMVSTAVNVYMGARFLRLSSARLLNAELIVELATILAAPAGMLAARRELRAVVEWSRGQPDGAEASSVVRAARSLPRRVVIGGYAYCGLGIVPAAVVVLLAHWPRATPFEYISLYAVAMAVSLYAFLLAWFWLQATMRPVLADVAIKAPAANRVERRAASTAVNVLVALVYATALAGVIVGSLVRRPGSGVGGMWATGGIAIAASITVILILVLLAGLRVLVPLRELIRGTEAVAAGDLDVQVPVTSNDELGALAQSFNEMVSGLRERERLREDNVGLVAELRASRERIVAAADAERRNLERDLHDGAQQQLVLVGLKLAIARRQLDADPEAAKSTHDEIRKDLDRALAELRDLAHGIYPAQLQNEGLAGAVRAAVDRAAIPVDLNCDGIGRYQPEIEAAIYFCCLEALQNAAKHAGEDARTTVLLAERDSAITFEVKDDGPGFDVSATNASHGLQNMADRVGALGGKLTISSAPRQGTTVAGTVPLDRSRAVPVA
jgi:signal transduction histidine kinase